MVSILLGLLSEAMDRYRREVTPREKSARWEDTRLQKLMLDEIAHIKLATRTYEDFEDWIESERARSPRGRTSTTASASDCA